MARKYESRLEENPFDMSRLAGPVVEANEKYFEGREAPAEDISELLSIVRDSDQLLHIRTLALSCVDFGMLFQNAEGNSAGISQEVVTTIRTLLSKNETELASLAVCQSGILLINNESLREEFLNLSQDQSLPGEFRATAMQILADWAPLDHEQALLGSLARRESLLPWQQAATNDSDPTVRIAALQGVINLGGDVHQVYNNALTELFSPDHTAQQVEDVIRTLSKVRDLRPQLMELAEKFQDKESYGEFLLTSVSQSLVQERRSFVLEGIPFTPEGGHNPNLTPSLIDLNDLQDSKEILEQMQTFLEARLSFPNPRFQQIAAVGLAVSAPAVYLVREDIKGHLSNLDSFNPPDNKREDAGLSLALLSLRLLKDIRAAL
ncbi:MAG: hypothetical protein KDD60_04000 [Bdellovibrionales bacterium]|nr:hypothetical protein [Bdellovibrionales bacterium]